MVKLAIIETGGKQYKVASGDVISIEKIKGLGKGDSVSFEKVLLQEDGGAVKIGTPYLSGVKIEGIVTEEGKGRKLVVQKYKPKVRYRKRLGHRQPFMKVKIK